MSSLMRVSLAGLAMIAMAACGGESVSGPDVTPLTGLSKSTSGDTSNTTHTPTGSGPGFFRGTVMGPSAPGAGNDSLLSAPRVAGVVVTIYERKAGTGDAVEAGDQKGTVTTGSDGLFTLPTLPAGEYVVTFVPPSTSVYNGVYVFGPLRENSSNYRWWVVLSKK